jgi:hypothetical protein
MLFWHKGLRWCLLSVSESVFLTAFDTGHLTATWSGGLVPSQYSQLKSHYYFHGVHHDPYRTEVRKEIESKGLQAGW